MKTETYNKWFSIFILVGMTIAVVLTTIFKLGDSDTGRTLLIVSAFGSLMGVMSSITSANGKILTFLFGLLDVSIYGVMCFMNWQAGGSGLGTAVLHMVYFVPMQFVGYWQWRKRGAEGNRTVKPRRLTGKQWLVYGTLFVIGSWVAYCLIAHFDKSAADGFIKMAVVLDVLPLMCNILGQLLMSTAYIEQWIFWLGVNVFSILMWSKALAEGTSVFATIYIIKYCFYFANSVHGLRNWLRLSRES